MTTQWLSRFAGSQWAGHGELWLDSEGNKADHCDCELRIDADALRYSWSYEGQDKQGSFVFNDAGAIWTDTWHQPQPATCVDVAGAWGLFTVEHSYDVSSGAPWGWRSKLSERPDGSLVLQMTNLTPWGEEGRAVRMIVVRQG